MYKFPEKTRGIGVLMRHRDLSYSNLAVQTITMVNFENKYFGH
jgi:hypothetical protein